MDSTGAAFASRGMHVNDHAGKAEALVRFYGPGAAEAKEEINNTLGVVTADSWKRDNYSPHGTC